MLSYYKQFLFFSDSTRHIHFSTVKYSDNWKSTTLNEALILKHDILLIRLFW